MKIYTRKGDDGTTGLLYGGRVRKDDPGPMAYGERRRGAGGDRRGPSHVARGGELDELLVAIERDLWVLMAELATDESNRHKLTDGASRVTDAMVEHLEATIDDLASASNCPPSSWCRARSRVSAFLDVARTVVRRAERHASLRSSTDSRVVAYLNRLSDLLWTLARWQEGDALTSRST